MLRNVSVVVASVLLCASLLIGQGPYSGTGRTDVAAIIGDSTASLRSDIDSIITRLDSLIALSADSVVAWQYMLTLSSRIASDSTATWIELTEVRTSLDSVADSLSAAISRINTNTSDIVDLVTGIDTMSNKVDSLAIASALADVDVNTRIDSVRDNVSGGSTASFVWLDTTAFDFALVSERDTADYDFIRDFSRKFVVSGDRSDSTQTETLENLFIEICRSPKSRLDIACSFDTLFMSDSTYFDTVFNKYARFYGMNRPGREKYYPTFLKDNANGYNYLAFDSTYSTPQKVSAGVLEYFDMGFRAAFSTSPGGGLIGGSGYLAAIPARHHRCFGQGDFYYNGSHFTSINEFTPGDSLSFFYDCVFDTANAYSNHPGGAVHYTNCTGTLYKGGGYNSKCEYYNCTFTTSDLSAGGPSTVSADNCSFTAWGGSAKIFDGYNQIQRVQNCTFSWKPGAATSLMYASHVYNCTFWYGGCQSYYAVQGNTFYASPVGTQTTNWPTVIMDNSYRNCTTALNVSTNARVYRNHGYNNTTWMTGTPADSAGNFWK